MAATCAIPFGVAVEQEFERDPTDLGLPPDLDEYPRLPSPRVAGDVPHGEPASPEQAAAHSARIRAALGMGPSPSVRLAVDCGGCGAPARRWCRQRGREVFGRLCRTRIAGPIDRTDGSGVG